MGARDKKFENEDALYNVLNLIFYAMVGVPLIIFLYLYLEIKDGTFVAESADEDLNMVLHILIPLFGLINIGLAYIFYRNVIKDVQSTAPLREKLKKFYTASLMKYSFLSAATFLSLIGLFFTAQLIYVGFYLFVLLIFSLNRPSPFRFRRDMKIKTFPPAKKNITD